MTRALAVVAILSVVACGKYEAWRESIMVWGGQQDLDHARQERKVTLVLFCREGAPECAEEILFHDRRLRRMLECDVVPVRLAHPDRTLPPAIGVFDADGRQKALLNQPVDEEVVLAALRSNRPLRW